MVDNLMNILMFFHSPVLFLFLISTGGNEIERPKSREQIHSPDFEMACRFGTGSNLPPHHQNDRQKSLSISGMGLKLKKYKEYYTLFSLQTHKGNENVRFSQKRVIFAEAPHIIIIGTALSRSLSGGEVFATQITKAGM